jgi:hypothetical protein
MNDHSRYARAESIAYNLSYKKHRSPDNENSIRVHFPAPQPAPVLVSV